MDLFLAVLRLLYVVVFFGALFISLKFQWGEEGKDERGKQILNTSYGIAFPLLPLGWLFIELYSDYVSSVSYEQYKMAIWFLLTGMYILHALFILVLRKKY
ncbi:hypothetical protein [Shouchella patagoniensis]|uniref:hypothetical protein n=1 Tax=Shouchella patagoniensis TaxID=228576 RepID=UPI000994C510|nr:hypothetical protein [Shouchella patagoniensis]